MAHLKRPAIRDFYGALMDFCLDKESVYFATHLDPCVVLSGFPGLDK